MHSTYYSIPTVLDYSVMICDLSAAHVMSKLKHLALLQQNIADPWSISIRPDMV
jgi:hypothetical protein